MDNLSPFHQSETYWVGDDDEFFTGANLSGANLSGANLSGANLSGANLSGAYLYEANFRKAVLTGACCCKAIFRGAFLREADFTRADLRGASLIRIQGLATNFSFANFTGACIEDWNINSSTILENVICDYI